MPWPRLRQFGSLSLQGYPFRTGDISIPGGGSERFQHAAVRVPRVQVRFSHVRADTVPGKPPSVHPTRREDIILTARVLRIDSKHFGGSNDVKPDRRDIDKNGK